MFSYEFIYHNCYDIRLDGRIFCHAYTEDDAQRIVAALNQYQPPKPEPCTYCGQTGEEVYQTVGGIWMCINVGQCTLNSMDKDENPYDNGLRPDELGEYDVPNEYNDGPTHGVGCICAQCMSDGSYPF